MSVEDFLVKAFETVLLIPFGVIVNGLAVEWLEARKAKRKKLEKQCQREEQAARASQRKRKKPR